MAFCFRLISTLVITAAVTAPAFAQSAQTPAAPASGNQAPPSDTVQAETGGPITIVPVGHASVQISHNGLWIDVDPTAARAPMPLREPDIILITDIHGDHLHPETIQRLRGPNTTVIAPPAAAEQVQNATTLENAENTTVRGATIEAVPMYNLERGPEPGQLFHPKGRGNGYIVTLGGTRLYFAGDTECTPEIRALQNIDVAFLPMNLPYTMTPAEAAECARAFQPDIVYPYHYRGQNPAEFTEALQGTGIEVRLREWYPPTPQGEAGAARGRSAGEAPRGRGAGAQGGQGGGGQ